MERKTSSDRLADAMRRARRHWQEEQREVAPPAPTERVADAFTIAISREAGANGCLVAEAVGEKLGWVVYDRDLVQLLGEEMGVRSSLVEKLDERRASWLRECVEAFASVPSVSQSTYLHHLVETLHTLAAYGECVIVGRGAAQILPGSSTLRVRLVADLNDRIRVIERRRKLTHSEATAWVKAVDRERAGFVMDNFRIDPSEPRRYDLIVNTSRFSIEESADIIIAALRRLQERAGPANPAARPPAAALSAH